MESFAALASEIAALTGTPCASAPERSVTGGSINTCYYWPRPGAAGPMFVKVGPQAARAAFAAEGEGLRELALAQAVRVPRVLATGVADAAAFLALEWIERGPADA